MKEVITDIKVLETRQEGTILYVDMVVKVFKTVDSITLNVAE